MVGLLSGEGLDSTLVNRQRHGKHLWFGNHITSRHGSHGGLSTLLYLKATLGKIKAGGLYLLRERLRCLSGGNAVVSRVVWGH